MMSVVSGTDGDTINCCCGRNSNMQFSYNLILVKNKKFFFRNVNVVGNCAKKTVPKKIQKGMFLVFFVFYLLTTFYPVFSEEFFKMH